MNRTEPTRTVRDVDLSALPEALPAGSSVLVAKPDSLTEHALSLRISSRYADLDDARLVLTTAVDADRTIEQYRAIVADSGAGRLGVVDASEGYQPSAPFQECPTVSLPNPSELTRIVLALQQLESTLAAQAPTIDVVVRSLSPMLTGSRLEQVVRVVDQLVDRQRSIGGVAVFGLEYTRHDDRTMRELQELVDAVVWVEETADGLRLDVQWARAR